MATIGSILVDGQDPSMPALRSWLANLDVRVVVSAFGLRVFRTAGELAAYIPSGNEPAYAFVADGATFKGYRFAANAWGADNTFYEGMSGVVQPLVDDAETARDQAVAAAQQFNAALPAINADLADLRALIGQIAQSIPIPGTFRSQRVGINNLGQSLGEGSNRGLTFFQESDSVGFAWRAVNPTALLPLTIANTQANNGGARGESPMYGAARHIKELIAARNIPTAASQDYQIVATNNAVGGQAIEYFAKGGANYAAVMSQITAAKNISIADGKTYKFAATFWTQGEAGSSDYSTKLVQLATDYNADAKAITGQTESAFFYTYQTPTALTIPLEQYKAHLASPLVVLATPIYHLSFYDPLHIDAASSQILGAYYGYVYWWQEVTRRTWEPVRPKKITRVSARVFDVEYYVPYGRLVFDTVNMPALTNNGFYLVQSEASLQVLPSVAALKAGTTNVVRVTADNDIPAGACHTYGLVSMAGKKPNVQGYGGNMRDTQGDVLKFDVKDSGNVIVSQFPLHNWGAVTIDAIPALA